MTNPIIIVGLGNPGEEYEATRHNAGRIIVDAFYKKAVKDHKFTDWRFEKKLKAWRADGKIGKQEVFLLKPDTFMNKSGEAVKPLITSVKKAHNLVVVHDDMDLPLGNFKINFNRGSGGHRGIESVMRAIKTKEFTRIKVGISPSTPGGKLRKPKGEDKVLDFIVGPLKPTEQEDLKKISKKITEAIFTLIEEGRERAMNEFN